MTEHTWRKSNRDVNGQDRVEVRHLDQARDSKNANGPAVCADTRARTAVKTDRLDQ